MKRSLAVILILLLSLSVALSGCGKSETVVGNWKTQISLSELINESMSELDPEMAEYFSFKDLNLTLLLSFTEDGRFTMEADKDNVTALITSLAAQMRTQIVPYLEEMFKEYNMDLDAILEGMDVDLDELVDSMLEEFVDESMFEELAFDGFYKTEESLLYMSTEKDDYDKDAALTFSFAEGKLILNFPEEAMDEPLLELLKSLTLERVD